MPRLLGLGLAFALATPGCETPEPPVPAPVAIAAPAPAENPSTATAVTVQLRVTQGRVGKNESLGKILLREGIDAQTQLALLDALKGVLDFRKLRPGNAYELVTGPDGKLHSFKLTQSPVDIYSAFLDTGKFRAEKAQFLQTTQLVRVEGHIESSLYQALMDAGESPNLAVAIADAFAWDIDFYSDTQKGDTFSVLIEKTESNGYLLGFGKVLAGEYKGSSVGHKKIFYYPGKGEVAAGYYGEDGSSAQRAFLKSPLKFTRITSRFGMRVHPMFHTAQFHSGVDYAAPTGTPVQAVADGKVIKAGWDDAGGKMVKIQHTSGYTSAYLHLSRIDVKAGAKVTQKTVVGAVGSTGRSTGPHLHFTLLQNGKLINPLKRVAPRTKPIGAGDLPAFRSYIGPWREMLASGAGRSLGQVARTMGFGAAPEAVAF